MHEAAIEVGVLDVQGKCLPMVKGKAISLVKNASLSP
jgi:hypothetical protein